MDGGSFDGRVFIIFNKSYQPISILKAKSINSMNENVQKNGSYKY